MAEIRDANVIPYHKSNRGRTATNVAKKTAAKPTKKTPVRKAGAAGRKAFQGEYCEIHSGLREDGSQFLEYDPDGNEIFGGQGCAKFSHLDTTGRGLYKVPWWRVSLSILAKSAKPIIMVFVAVGIFYVATHFVGRALHFGNTLPGPTHSSVPTNVRPSPANSVSHRGLITPTSILGVYRHDGI